MQYKFNRGGLEIWFILILNYYRSDDTNAPNYVRFTARDIDSGHLIKSGGFFTTLSEKLQIRSQVVKEITKL